MATVSSDTIKLILSEKFDENFWLFELGRTENILAHSPNIEHQFMDSFFDKGEKMWNEYKEKLKGYLCDNEDKAPKKIIKGLADGSDLVATIITVLTETHSTPVSIAIPLCAIVLKKGLNSFCN